MSDAHAPFTEEMGHSFHRPHGRCYLHGAASRLALRAVGTIEMTDAAFLPAAVRAALARLFQMSPCLPAGLPRLFAPPEPQP